MLVVLIPAYKPDEELIKLLRQIKESDLEVLIVDDGSGDSYTEIFNQATAYGIVEHLPYNQGKGCALKHGMKVLRNYYPQCTHFVTADSDGQHKAEDILRVARLLEQGSEMVLSMRDFQGDIPARSRVGNALSRWIYTVLTGFYLSDNQSGLRGYSVEQISWLLEVKGDKYDYEMNTLYFAYKLHVKIDTLPIKSLYFNGNKSSHFNPVSDTLRIYRSLFRSASSSLLTALLCQLIIIFLTITKGYEFCYVTIPLTGVICGFFCMITNGIVFLKMKYRDAWWTLFYLGIRFLVYTLVCTFAGMWISFVPLWLIFDVTAIALLFGRYQLHKTIAIHKNKKKN